MKKVVMFLVAFVLVANFLVFATAANSTTNSSVNSSTNSPVNSSTNSNVVISGEGFEKSFNCLNTNLGANCDNAKTIEEMSLAILASANVSAKCLTKLENAKKTGNCWGDAASCTVEATAMAILALDHAGKDTTLSEAWILSKKIISTDLVWFLQQDSKLAAGCKLSYLTNNKSEEKNVQVYENKKISGAAGTCLSLASGSFWLQVAPNAGCYNTEYKVSCDQDFLATLLYKQKNSPTIYVLSDTAFSPKLETISLSLKSFCFGDSATCSYPATVWAAVALLKTGNSVEEIIPYIVAMEETNKPYLPKAFSYMVTEENEYALQLIEQKGGLNDFWLASASAHDKYYDSALAYLAISGFNSEADAKLRKWFEFSQSPSGCWEGADKTLVRDTAMVLWALEGKKFSGGNTEVRPTTRCTEAGFWCMTDSECLVGQDVSDNYFCDSMTRSTCCTSSNLKDCSELDGTVCQDGYVCDAGSQDSNDGTCCLGECIEEPTESECELKDYFCKSSCSSSQVEKSGLACIDSADVCCAPASEKKSGSSWIWVLIILIIIVIVAICWIKREQLKLWWFKMKTKFRKDKGRGSSTTNSGMPPKPGFPPIRSPPQMMRRPMPPRSPVSAPARGQLDDVFKKLNEMSK